ncbi:MAG: 5'-3' exonuclease [Egibacteraceae bacterium]
MEALSLFDVVVEPQRTAVLPPPSVVHRRPAPAPVPAVAVGPVLAVVDGNSLAHRAFHAYPPEDSAGPRYGFLALFAAICDKVAPDAVAVGFDDRASSRRRERWPGYKAQRPEKDPALYRLLQELPRLLDSLGVRTVVPEGWEADDVLGSASSAAERAGWRCVVATSDRDAFGLVSDLTHVLRLRSGMDAAVLVDRGRLRRDLAIEPEQYVEFAALRGDVSDNLPGIPGIGRRRAAALLEAFPTVAAACADPLGCRSVLGPALGQAVLEDFAATDSVFIRNVELMTIRRDLAFDVSACRCTATPDQISEVLAAAGISGLSGRLSLALATRPDIPPPAGDADAPPV